MTSSFPDESPLPADLTDEPNREVGKVGLIAADRALVDGLESLLTQVVDALDGSPALPVESRGVKGTLTDRSGTIAAGGASQQAAATNAARQYLLIENVSDTDMWVNFGTAAVANQPSILLKAGGGSLIFEDNFIPTGSVNVLGATTGKAFTCKEA